MSTENTIQSTANQAAVQVTEKSEAAKAQTSQPSAKKAVRKVAPKASRKNAPKAPVKARTAVARKPVNSSAKKPPTLPAKKLTTKTASQPKAAPMTQTALEAKLKKPKLVRDSFTFPKDEYQAIAGLKQKALGLKHSAKKSEILRAGLKLLSSLNDKAFLAALANVPALKTGRPAKS